MKTEKSLHLFKSIGDDEIQIESCDKKFNKEVMKLQKAEPEAVIVIYDDEATAFLRAAVKMNNISISLHKTAE